MKLQRSVRGLVAACLCLLGATACPIDVPVGTAGFPENYQVFPVDLGVGAPSIDDNEVDPPASPTALHPLVRDRRGNADSPVGAIRSIAVTGRYLYFATGWEGVYRVPAGGGAIEVVEAAVETKFEQLAATDDRVFWAKSRFDDRDYPSVEIKRRLDSGGPTKVLFAGDWGVGSSNTTSTFQASSTGVYLFAGRAGPHPYNIQHIPLEGGPISIVLEVSRDWQDTVWPSWAVEGDDIYFTLCEMSPPPCALKVITRGQPAAREIASLQASARVVGTDNDAVYLFGATDVWRVAKAGGAVTSLVHFERGSNRWVGFSGLVDQTYVYFTSSDNEGPALFAQPKTGGPPRRLSADPTLRDVAQLAQGKRTIYVLHDSFRQISALAKP